MQRRTAKNRLGLLAGTTTVALLGILVLQGYWLLTSYKQEQTRFRAEVENALTAMIVRTQFAAVYKTADGSAFSPETQDTIGGMLLSLIGSVPENAPVPVKTGMLNPDGTPKMGFFWTTEDTVEVLPPAVDSPDGFTLTIQDFPKVELSKMQKVMKAILRKGNISTPLELALLDSNKQILEAT